MSETNSASTENPLTLILEQLTSMNERLVALESRPQNATSQPTVPPAKAKTPAQHDGGEKRSARGSELATK